MPAVRTAYLTKPFGYVQQLRAIAQLKRSFPGLRVESIGRSVMGRELPALRIGSGSRQLFLSGAIHANEWITAPIVLGIVEQCARAERDGTALLGVPAAELLRAASLWAVPMVNPDGVELVLRGARIDSRNASRLVAWNGGSDDFAGWKANIRGVDLNDQFPAYWEEERDRRCVDGPGPRDYTGEAPLSEPEAAALAAFTEEKQFDAVIAYHTQGEEIYWNYRGYEPEHAARLADRLALAGGYRAVKLTGSDAGYKDWFIRRWRRPGFTVEAGLGRNPLPLAQFPGMLRACSAIALHAMLATCGSN